jgi:hypothetical protein
MEPARTANKFWFLVVLLKAVFPVYAYIVVSSVTSFEINHPGDGLVRPETCWKMYDVK